MPGVACMVCPVERPHVQLDMATGLRLQKFKRPPLYPHQVTC